MPILVIPTASMIPSIGKNYKSTKIRCTNINIKNITKRVSVKSQSKSFTDADCITGVINQGLDIIVDTPVHDIY